MLTLSGKWEMIWKNPDKISGFSVLRTKVSGQTKQIPGSNATLFITSARSTDIAAEEVVVSVVLISAPPNRTYD